MKSGPHTIPTDRAIHPAAAVLIVLGVCLLAWAVIAAVVLGVLIVAGTWGLLGLAVAGAAVWRGVFR
jgi:hypothetical protein